VVTSTIPNTVTSNVSGAIVVGVTSAPAISAQPSGSVQTIACVGNAAAPISVTATGTGLTYQWYSNTANSNAGGILIAGATGNSYTPLTNSGGMLFYYVVVANSGGCSITSAVSGAVTVANTLNNVGLTSTTLAGAAYSLRRLSSCYNGPAINVRRSNNDSMDIGFTASGDLDTTALKAFVGVGNDGFVTTWYDQSGNGRNATQTVSTRQPQIVASGAVLTMNGRPALRFNGSTTFLDAPDVVMTGQNWTFNGTATMASETQSNARLVSAVRSVASGGTGADWSDPASWVILNRSAATSQIGSERVTGGMNIATNTPYVISITRNSGASIGVLNGVTTVTSSSSLSDLNTTLGLRIGRSINPSFEANEHWAGLSSDIVLLQNLSTTERQTLENNQGAYYGISF
jgi:hypothetical protein